MHRERRNFGINAVIFILFTANIWLRSFHVSAARLATTDSAVSTTSPKVDCSKAGPGYSTLGYIYVKGENRSTARAHLGRFLPPGCSMIFGRGNFVNCVKMVCPCKDKACGDTCVPARESIGQFKCQARANGFGCVPADSVKCPAQKVVVSTKSNLRAEKKLTPGG